MTAPTALLAAEEWIAYSGRSNLYKVRLPKDYKIDAKEFLLGNGLMAAVETITGEVAPDLDEGGANDSIKTYKVVFQQTLGQPLDEDLIKKLLDDENLGFLEEYKQYDGYLSKMDNYFDNTGLHINDFEISYKDPDLGIRYIHVRTAISGVTKLQLVSTGSESGIASYRTDDFFKMVTLHDGHLETDKKIHDTWEAHTSPNKLFTAYYPGILEPYTVEEPKTKNSDRSEVMAFEYYDPVLKQKLYYKIYGYKFNVKLNRSAMIKVLQDRHIMRYSPKTRYMSFSNSVVEGNGAEVIETSFAIPLTDTNKTVSYARLKSYAKGNYMIVHELLGSSRLARGVFADNLIKSVEFHPEVAIEHERSDSKSGEEK
ncbi:MAG: hypothetical protein KDI46_03740 [Alphaproteobacteria bacterium]|nr:hypothetical protein [Alphaproteobacteria bacterium]